MKKERLKVLEMLEAGKISVEDATKLLDALKTPEAEMSMILDCDEAEEQLNKFSQSVDSFAKEFSEKVGGAYKDIEPKLKNVTRTVIEKAVTVIDDISKSLNESLKNLDEQKKEEKFCCEESQPAEECCGNGPAPECEEACAEECTEEKPEEKPAE